MTNEEFIRRLKKARKLALTEYKGHWRIFDACQVSGINWNCSHENAIFGEGTEYENRSSTWLTHVPNTTEANVRAVFDNSILALGGKP